MQHLTLVRGEWTISSTGQWDFAINPFTLTGRMIVPPDINLDELTKEIKEKFDVVVNSTLVELSYQLARCGSVAEMRSVPPLIIRSTDELHLLFNFCGGANDVQLYVTFKLPLSVNGGDLSREPYPLTQGTEGYSSNSSHEDELDYNDWQDLIYNDGSSKDSSSPDATFISSSENQVISPSQLDSAEPDSPQLAQGTPPRQPVARNLFGYPEETPIVTSNNQQPQNVTSNNKQPENVSSNISPSSAAKTYWDRFAQTMHALGSQLASNTLSATGGHAIADLEDVGLPNGIFHRDAEPFSDDSSDDEEIGDGDELDDVRFEDDSIFVGKKFRNKRHCKIKMAVHAINRKFHFKHERSTKKLLVLKCIGANCKWRVRNTRMPFSPRFQVRKAYLQHTCTVHERSNFNRQATTAVIGELVKAKYTGLGKGPKPRELQHILFSDYNISVSYWKAWRARELAMANVKGTSEGSFSLLPFYVHLLTHFNPGTICKLDTEDDGKEVNRFKSLFFSLGASVEGWPYLRKVVIIDGTHMLGKYGGCLVTASGQDGNHQIFPLAFGVVDGENDSSWEWFFKNLQAVIPDSEDLVFVSDRHSSIYKGLTKEYPLAKHAFCIVHLARNITAIFKKPGLGELVSRAGRAYTQLEFRKRFEEIRRVDPGCADYLIAIGISRWARSHFEGQRYNIMTSNVAESLNHVLKEAREYPIVTMIECIRATLMSWFVLRRKAASPTGDGITKTIASKIQKNFAKSTSFSVSAINEWAYAVVSTNNRTYEVDLRNLNCSCGAFQILQYPCPHAIAAANRAGVNVNTLVAKTFFDENTQKLYASSIRPIPGIPREYSLMCPEFALELKPPRTRRPPGRPHKKRIRSNGEYPAGTPGNANRRCGRCRVFGHNRRTCRNPI